MKQEEKRIHSCTGNDRNNGKITLTVSLHTETLFIFSLFKNIGKRTTVRLPFFIRLYPKNEKD